MNSEQIQVEINWLKNQLKKKLSQKHRKTILHQIKQKEYNLHLGKEIEQL